MSRIYASLPLSGPQARLGREVLRGAELALDGAELVALDSSGPQREDAAVANAERAVADPEAMALIVDALAAAGPDRSGIVRVARATRDRDSILGRYSIDPDGHTTATECGRLAVVGGQLAWD